MGGYSAVKRSELHPQAMFGNAALREEDRLRRLPRYRPISVTLLKRQTYRGRKQDWRLLAWGKGLR